MHCTCEVYVTEQSVKSSSFENTEVSQHRSEVFVLRTGLKWEAIEMCVNWMAPFVETMMRYESAQLKEFGQVPSEDRHNIQTHVDYLCMLVSLVLN